MKHPADLQSVWSGIWPEALGVWSKYTRLKPPVYCRDSAAARKEGLASSFAMIRLHDQAIVVDLDLVARLGLEDFGLEILAHEIGHHVLAPASLTEHARMIARMRRALPTVEHHAPMVSNLYTDLLINDRLERSAGLRLARLYGRLGQRGATGVVWELYMRMYEILWRLDKGRLTGKIPEDRIEGDAWLGARLLRSFAGEWLDGAGRFAALMLPHLLADERSAQVLEYWNDTRNAGAGGSVSGLTEVAAEEIEGATHPALDPALNESTGPSEGDASPFSGEIHVPASVIGGQAREPFEYGEILRYAGVEISDHDAAVAYYREQAAPHIVRFPALSRPRSEDPLPEGLEPWDIGHPIDDVDWLQTVIQSPTVIPGMTMVQRMWGRSEGAEPKRRPLDLDIYVDSSGSMANPQQRISYPALAGAIICLSALRAGARVQATLWSGKHQVETTDGFIQDERKILRVLTGYFGGATAFPIHKLRETYASGPGDDRCTHILHISDDGISSLFDRDEKGNDGWQIATEALARAGGGGTMALNLPADWDSGSYPAPYVEAIVRARDEQGWRVASVTSWEGLVTFARTFSKLKYSPDDMPDQAGWRGKR